MKRRKIHLVVWIVVVVLGSCAKKKPSVVSGDSAKKENVRPVVVSEFVSWPQNYWSAKAKIYVQIKGNSIPVNLTLRAEQGKCIWFSANAMGLMEVARGKIDEDSVQVLDKFNNRCYVGGMKGLGEFLPVAMGIKQLQHLLMGRVFWDSLSVGNQVVSGDSTLIEGNQGEISFSARLFQKYNLVSAKAESVAEGNSVFLVNSQFKPSMGFPIAWNKEISSKQRLDGKETLSKVRIEFTKFEFVPTSPDFSFDLPADCERQVLK